MSKLTDAEKDKLDNTCGNLRVTKLGTHVKTLEDFVNEGVLDTRANTVVEAINELYGMIVNKDCEGITIPPPGFFTLFGNDEDGKLYCYYNDQDHPPLFEHIETPGELEGTLYLYIADPEGNNHFRMEIGHYIAVKHLNNYYTKAQCDAKYPVTVQKQADAESGYAATYVVKQNNAQVGTKINIPKDFFLKGGSVKTCTVANVPVQGYIVGDKYLDMEINVEDGGATTKHMYILLKDLAPLYRADESTLTLSNDNVFSVKDGGISSTKIAGNAVTTAKIAGNAVTNDKISSVAGSKVIDSNAHSNIGSSANSNQNSINTAIDTKISKLATKEQVDKIIAGDIDLTGYLKDDVGTVKSTNISSIGAEKITNTKKLTTEDNLDNLTSTGRYYANATTIKTITDNVFQISCIIEVTSWGTSSGVVLQRMYRLANSQSSNTIYYRIKHANGWLDWQKISIDGHNHDNLYLQKIGGVSQNSNGNITLPTDYQSTNGATGNIPISSNMVKDTQSLTDSLPALKTLIGSIKDSDAKWWNIISARHGNGSNDGNMYGLYLKSLLLGDGDLIWNKQYSNGSTSTWIGERTILDSNNCKNYSTKPLMTWIDSISSQQDLNDYKTAGFYYCKNDSTEAPRITNQPRETNKKSFFMLVETWGASSNYVKQTLTYYDNGDTYVRTKSTGSATGNWKGWKLLATTDHTHGYLTSDGKLGGASGKIVMTCTDGKICAMDSISKSLINDFPTSMTPTSHAHGNLQNNGQVGSTVQASKNVVTDANGKITTENKPSIPTKTSQLTNDGDGTNVFVKNNDSRITNSVNTACKVGFALSSSSTTPATSLEFTATSGQIMYAFVRNASGGIPSNITKGYMVVNGSFLSKTVYASDGSISAYVNVKGTYLIEAGFFDANGWVVASATCKVTVS